MASKPKSSNSCTEAVACATPSFCAAACARSALRPATPTNIPYIGQTALLGLWVNAGHGTLGWTHGAGSGKALAARVDGEEAIAGFPFLGG